MATKETIKLNATLREAGKHVSRGLRMNRQIPAVVYGPKTKSISLFIAENDAIKVSKKGFDNAILTFESTDSSLNGLKVLKKVSEIHPVSRRPLHLDFFAPDMTQKVRVNVEVRYTGKAQGTTEGGLVSTVRRDVEVECLPLEIPEFFTLDISGLGLNSSLHVSDITFPENLKVITSTGETLVTCAEVKEEIITAPVVEAAAADGAAAPAAGAAAGAGGAAPGAAPAADGKAPAAGGKAPAGDKK